MASSVLHVVFFYTFQWSVRFSGATWGSSEVNRTFIVFPAGVRSIVWTCRLTCFWSIQKRSGSTLFRIILGTLSDSFLVNNTTHQQTSFSTFPWTNKKHLLRPLVLGIAFIWNLSFRQGTRLLEARIPASIGPAMAHGLTRVHKESIHS